MSLPLIRGCRLAKLTLGAAQSESSARQTNGDERELIPTDIGEIMNRRLKVEPAKTMPDLSSLIGESLQRSDLRSKAKWRACLRKLTEISIRALRFSE
jgi:hypothetical protein